jgi:hypothetical protein
MWNILEQPWTLVAVAIVALLVLLMVRGIFPEKRRWWQLLLPVVILVAAFGLDFLVQTDTEKITALINAASKAVEEENPDAIEHIISDDYYDSFHHTKQRLIQRCRDRLSRPLVRKNITRIVEINLSPPTATATFTVRILFDERSEVYQSFKQLMLTKLKLDLQKQPDNRWLINRAELLEIDMQPAGWKDTTQLSW